MFTNLQIRRIRSALSRAGERVTIIIDGKRYHERAVVQNSGKNFMRKYDDDESKTRELGRARKRDKIAFFPFFDEYNATDNDIFVLWRGRKFLVVADSVLQLGDEPFCFWALMTEMHVPKEGYYDDIE